MSTFIFDIEYKNTKGVQHTSIEVEAPNATRAKTLALAKFGTDLRRRNSRVIRAMHIGGSITTKEPKPAPCSTTTFEKKVDGVVVGRTTQTTCPPEPQEFAVGDVLNIVRGEMQGKAIVRAKFKDNGGVDHRTIEFLGYTPYGKNKFATGTLARLRERTTPLETITYKAIYPSGEVYDSDRPIQTSSYGLDQIIQVKITKRGTRIVKKEIVG